MNPDYGVSILSIVPVRTEPSDKSEMCTQLLFGDHFLILESTEKWTRIQTAIDEYEGWIDNKQFESISQAEFVKLHDLNFVVGIGKSSHAVLNTQSGEYLNLLAGSNLPEVDGLFFQLNGIKYQLETEVCRPVKDKFRETVLETARFYLNSPYLWGGA